LVAGSNPVPGARIIKTH